MSRSSCESARQKPRRSSASIAARFCVRDSGAISIRSSARERAWSRASCRFSFISCERSSAGLISSKSAFSTAFAFFFACLSLKRGPARRVIKSLRGRPPRRFGNVSRVELLGREVWSQLNHHLLLVTVDIGEAGIDQDLSALLPQGSQVSVVGAFGSVQEWPEPHPA